MNNMIFFWSKLARKSRQEIVQVRSAQEAQIGLEQIRVE